MSVQRERQLLIAMAAMARGQKAAAALAYRAALDADPDCDEARRALAALVWPGRPYLAVLADLHAILRPRRYVEIGVGTGQSLALATAAALAVGIDPAGPAEAPAGTLIRHEKAADYFARGGLAADLGHRPFDLAFVDGAHRFDDVLADVLALSAQASPKSLIVLHDCLPLDARSAAPQRRTGFWTGDGWKLVPLARARWPALALSTLVCPPSGLCLLSGIAEPLPAPPDDVLAGFRELPFEAFEGFRTQFGLTPSDREAVAARLAAIHGLP